MRLLSRSEPDLRRNKFRETDDGRSCIIGSKNQSVYLWLLLYEKKTKKIVTMVSVFNSSVY